MDVHPDGLQWHSRGWPNGGDTAWVTMGPESSFADVLRQFGRAGHVIGATDVHIVPSHI